jgi:hypothetical protein
VLDYEIRYKWAYDGAWQDTVTHTAGAAIDTLAYRWAFSLTSVAESITDTLWFGIRATDAYSNVSPWYRVSHNDLLTRAVPAGAESRLYVFSITDEEGVLYTTADAEPADEDTLTCGGATYIADKIYQFNGATISHPAFAAIRTASSVRNTPITVGYATVITSTVPLVVDQTSVYAMAYFDIEAALADSGISGVTSAHLMLGDAASAETFAADDTLWATALFDGDWDGWIDDESAGSNGYLEDTCYDYQDQSTTTAWPAAWDSWTHNDLMVTSGTRCTDCVSGQTIDVDTLYPLDWTGAATSVFEGWIDNTLPEAGFLIGAPNAGHDARIRAFTFTDIIPILVIKAEVTP